MAYSVHVADIQVEVYVRSPVQVFNLNSGRRRRSAGTLSFTKL